MSMNSGYKEVLLHEYHVTDERIRAAGLSWDVLDRIYRSHCAEASDLDQAATAVVTKLRSLGVVHSTRQRIKDPCHVLAKIVRKSSESKTRPITDANYRRRVTDLVGVRALHLFKGDWIQIHEFVRDTWDLAEQPVANVRTGDDKTLIAAFKKRGLSVREHPAGYRSVHYLATTSPSRKSHLVEIQVRTIFEEAWSEIDHRIRYPNKGNVLLLNSFLDIFNRLSGSADEMGTFIRFLDAEFRELTRQLEQQAQETDTLRRGLQDTVQKLAISRGEKASIEAKISSLLAKPVKSQNTIGDFFSELGRLWAMQKLGMAVPEDPDTD
jgi:putative GTP pyrophosphokinase